jgi:hypothetical protein
MHPLARSLFFTNRVVIGKDLFGNPVEAEGLYYNWLGRNLIVVVMAAWSILMLASATAHAETTDQAGAGQNASILYSRIAWGNAVDSGTSLVPVGAYKSQSDCDDAKSKAAKDAQQKPQYDALMCAVASTTDEKNFARMLLAKNTPQ